MSNESILISSPPDTLSSALRLVARILDSVMFGAETNGNLKTELVGLLDQIMDKYKDSTLRKENDGNTYTIHREQKEGVDQTVNGVIQINLTTFICTYTTDTGVTALHGPQDDNGTISFLESGRISQKNIDIVLKKIGINAGGSCCIS